METPTWLYGKDDADGEKWFQRCKEVFQPYPPTSKRPIANFTGIRLAPGKATAGPPVGPMFSSLGVKSIDFVKAFNAATLNVFNTTDPDFKLKVHIRFFEDKTYQWRILPPYTSWLLRKAAGIPRISKAGWGCGPGIGNHDPPLYEGYITIEILYHVAALVQTWDRQPDWITLEWRVVGLISACQRQGICVLGVHTHPSPVLGKTDAEYLEEVREKKEAWNKKREQEADCNPLVRLPWIERLGARNTEGFEIPSKEEAQMKADAKKVVKEAQVIDKHFQDLLDKEEVESRKGAPTKVMWDEWKASGFMTKRYNEHEWRDDPQAVKVRGAYTEYLARRYPSAIPRTQYLRAMWHTDHWDKYLPENGAGDLHQSVR